MLLKKASMPRAHEVLMPPQLELRAQGLMRSSVAPAVPLRLSLPANALGADSDAVRIITVNILNTLFISVKIFKIDDY